MSCVSLRKLLNLSLLSYEMGPRADGDWSVVWYSVRSVDSDGIFLGHVPQC